MKTEGRTHIRFSKVVIIALSDGSRTCATSKSIPLCAPAPLRETLSYTYDRLGRQLSAIAAGVSTNLFTYSGLDLVSETQNGGWHQGQPPK